MKIDPKDLPKVQTKAMTIDKVTGLLQIQRAFLRPKPTIEKSTNDTLSNGG